MLINVQYLFHTLSQISNQNDNNELIKNLSHILDQINNSKIYVRPKKKIVCLKACARVRKFGQILGKIKKVMRNFSFFFFFPDEFVELRFFSLALSLEQI